MNLRVAEAFLYAVKVCSWLLQIAAITVVIGMLVVFPVGLALMYTGNDFGGISVLIVLGGLTWAIGAFFLCLRGCEWLYWRSKRTVQKAAVAPGEQVPTAPSAIAEQAADPIESV
jgi:hypothetical protein